MFGNGFDLAQNLKTSYQHFYQYLVGHKPVNTIEAKMIKQLRGEDYDKWSDLESALGEFTKDVNDKEEFEEFYYDLCDKLRTYLISQVTNYEPSAFLKEKYAKDLVRPDYYLTRREQVEYENLFNRFHDIRHIYIVSFNYTDVLDKCLDVYNQERKLPTNSYDYQLVANVKIHGTLGTSYLLMGVNDEKQIANTEFAKDEDVLDYMLKPRSNYEIGTRIEESVTQFINEAHLIIAMGLSFGETDRIWWYTIGRKLKSDSKVHIILFAHVSELPKDERRKLPIKRRIRRDFLSKCGIGKEECSLYEDKIYVCLNSCIFSPNVYVCQDERKGL